MRHKDPRDIAIGAIEIIEKTLREHNLYIQGENELEENQVISSDIKDELEDELSIYIEDTFMDDNDNDDVEDYEYDGFEEDNQ